MITLIAAFLLGAPTAAAQDSWVQTEGTGCSQNATPIAGTTGFANARSALRTNAQTYAATNWAERALLPGAAKKGGGFAMEAFTMLGAAEVASVETGAGTDENCPADHRVSVRPVDLQAVALGVVGRAGDWSFFYAGSTAFGNPAFPNPYARGMLIASNLVYGSMGTMAAPLAPNGFSTQQGASAFAIDWVAGASLRKKVGAARIGYAGSRGLYAGLTESRLGLFGNALLGGADAQDALLGFAAAGVDRFDWSFLAKGIGLTTVQWRNLPFGGVAPVSATDAGALLPDRGRLQTARLAHANIGGHVDLSATWATRPASALYEASVAVHSKGYVRRRDATAGPKGGSGFYAQAGIVDLPGQAALGLEPKRRPAVRLEGTVSDFAEMEGAKVAFAVLYNDPEMLALYPTSVDALALRYSLQVAF